MSAFPTQRVQGTEKKKRQYRERENGEEEGRQSWTYALHPNSSNNPVRDCIPCSGNDPRDPVGLYQLASSPQFLASDEKTKIQEKKKNSSSQRNTNEKKDRKELSSYALSSPLFRSDAFDVCSMCFTYSLVYNKKQPRKRHSNNRKMFFFSTSTFP